MKNFKLFIFGLFLSIFGFSFVNASEYKVYNFGAESCVDSDNNIVYTCDLTASGNVISTSYNLRVTPFILSIDEFDFYNDSTGGKRVCFYTDSYTFISCTYLSGSSTDSIVSPSDSYFMRISYGNNNDSILYDDTNVSSLSVLSNTLTSLLSYIIQLVNNLNIIIYIVLGITIVLVLVGIIKWLRS